MAQDISLNNEDSDFWILAIAGGGYRGLFAATALAELERHVGVPLARKFDLIAGTSVGSILASALAKEIPANVLPSLFLNHGQAIFHGRWKQWPILRTFNLGFFSSRYSNRGLRDLLLKSELLGETCFKDLGHRLLIPAVNLSKGGPQFFKTQHVDEYLYDGTVRLVDAVLASAAAPTYFPVYRFNDSRYADGGLVANSPAFVACHEAIYKLKRPVGSIYVVTVGTMNKTMTMDPRVPLDIGLLGGFGRRFWRGWRQRVFEVTLSAQEAMSNAMLSHVLPNRILTIDVQITTDQAKAVSLDAVTEQANEVLQGQAREAAKSAMTGPLFNRWKAHTAVSPSFYNQ